MAARAGLAPGVVGRGAFAGAGFGAVQILPPEQKLDGMVAGGDIRLDATRFLQFVLKQRRRDLGGVDRLAIRAKGSDWR